jgi:surfactin family lipopeptide synthetase A
MKDLGTWVELVARRHPDATAVVHRGSATVTYGALASAARRVGQEIRHRVGRGSRVLIALPPSPSRAAAIVGALEAGSQPLVVPPRALAEALPVFDPALVMVEDRRAAGEPAAGATALAIAMTVEREMAAGSPDEAPPIPFWSDGHVVLAPRRSLVDRIAALQEIARLEQCDVVLTLAEASGSAWVREVAWPLSAGAALVPGADDLVARPDRLQSCATDRRATVVIGDGRGLAALIQALAIGRLPALRAVVAVGAGLTRGAAEALARHTDAALIGLYAPPEVAREVAWTRSGSRGRRDLALLGRAVPGVELDIADGKGRSAPVGVVGRVRASMPGAMPTTTLDLGRARKDGGIELTGCAGRLTWIGSRRVDLDRVETAIAADPAIEDVAVLARPTAPFGSEVVAYVVTARRRPHDEWLRRWTGRLSDEDAPAVVVRVARIPTDRLGQVDEGALAAVEVIDHGVLASCESLLREVGAAEAIATTAEVREALPRVHRVDLLGTGVVIDAASGEPEAGAHACEVRPAVRGRPAVLHGPELARDPGGPRVLADLLTRAAASHGSAELIHVQADDSEVRQTYADLLAGAERVLAGLRRRGLRPGDRLILVCGSSHELLLAFWGCVLGGMVPFPMTAPAACDPTHAASLRLDRAWTLLEGPWLITTAVQAGDLRSLAADLGWAGFRIAVLDELQREERDAEHHRPGEEELALLLLTSGSTDAPKAVRLVHRQLLDNIAAAHETHRLDQRDVVLNWMPLEHVGGLVMVHLRHTASACRQVHAPTARGLEDPLRWFDWVDRYRATITWAPNFAYAILGERADAVALRRWDLSCVRLLMVGGEAIVALAIRRFLGLLRVHGLAENPVCPGWGMTETSSESVCGRFDPSSTDEVSIGTPMPGLSLRIASADGVVLSEGEAGRLQVRGRLVFSGYHGEAPPFDADGWFDTGDLGIVRDGRLIIAGRTKDVVIVNGVNILSHEVESVVDEIEGTETSFTAACAVRAPDSQTDDLAVFFHTRREGPALAALIRTIRGVVTERVGIVPKILLPLDRDEIPKTEIGKIRRAELARRFHAGAYADLRRRIDLLTGSSDTIPAWFFARTWRSRRRRTDPARDRRGGGLVVFGGESELTDEIGRAWPDVIVIEPGDAYRRISTRRFTVRPASADDHRRLLGEIAAQAAGGTILHTWSTRLPRDSSLALERSVYSVAALLRAAGQANLAPADLLIVTRGVHPVGDHPTDASVAATLGGLLRTARLELEGLAPRHLDLPVTPGAGDASDILQELAAHPARDPEVALRGGQRLLPGIQHLDMPGRPLGGFAVRAGRPYLLAGGTGGIGSLVSRFLLDRGAHVLVVGRTPLETAAHDGGAAARSARLTALALRGPVLYRPADVSDPAAMQRVVAEAEETWGASLAGVFHVAGANRGRDLAARMIACETRGGFDEEFRAKVHGTVVLGEIAAARRVPFIAFSSVNGLFPAAGFAAYAAASSFVEAYCDHLRARHPDTWCLSWSMWKETGMAAGAAAAIVDAAASQGFTSIDPEQGLLSLAAALHRAPASVLVGLDPGPARIRAMCVDAPIQLDRLRVYAAPTATGEVSLHDRFGTRLRVDCTRLPSLPRDESGNIDLVALESAGQASGGPELSPTERALAKLWIALLGVAEVRRDDSFFALGGHSLLATQLMARIRTDLGCDLALRELFDGPSLGELAAKVDARRAPDRGDTAIAPVPRDVPPPLSFAQQRLLFVQSLVPDGAGFNMPFCYRLRGALDLSALEASLVEIVRRHEPLRTSFVRHDGAWSQRISPAAGLPVAVTDLAALPAGERETACARAVDVEVIRRFDLSAGPPIRCSVFRLSAEEHVLLLTIHHIACDGWSAAVLWRELTALYRGHRTGTPPGLRPLAVQYADFVAWQRGRLTEQVREREVGFWQAELADAPVLLDLPTDRPRPAIHRGCASDVPLRIPEDLARRLERFAQASGSTPFMVLLAALYALLRRYTEQVDIVVGADVANRTHPQTEGMIGFFVNQLPLRMRGRRASFRGLVAEARAVTLAAYEHQELPFEEVIQAVNPERSTAHAPIFQVSLSLQNLPSAPPALHELDVAPVDVQAISTELDLAVLLHPRGGALDGWIVYNPDLFEAASMERFGARLVRLLDACLAAPASNVLDLPLDAAEDQAGAAGQVRPRAAAADESVGRAVSRCALAHRDEAAIVSREETLTYAELESRSDRVARHLAALGVGLESRVGICLERSPDLVIAMLGVLKAGAAVVPIEPSQPARRQSAILADSGARLVLARSEGLLGGCRQHPIDLCLTAVADDAPALAAARPEDVAVVVYTSGTTGRPKGVELTHGGLLNHARWFQAAFELGPADRVLQFHSVGFDVLLEEVLPALLAGARVVLRPPGASLSVAELFAAVTAQGVTVIDLPTGYWHELVRHLAERPLPLPPSVRLVVVGGETMSADALARWTRVVGGRARLCNAYGPTETTITSSVFLAPRQPGSLDRRVPIGWPIDNTQARVLDPRLRPVPVGIPGELFLGGDGVARGYAGLPGMTAERFIPDPFVAGARMYRTGDRVVRQADGALVFLGRRDRQVKVRGVRIEIGEIEGCLAEHPRIGQVAVSARPDGEGRPVLAAYVVLRQAGEAEEADLAALSAELRTFARQRLPEAMVPARFVPVPHLPLNRNGKVDHRALSAAEVVSGGGADELHPPRSEPTGALEAEIRRIWIEVLGSSSFAVDENFFDLGGTSLSLLRVHARLEDLLGRSIRLVELFQLPTVRALAARFAGEDGGAEPTHEGPRPGRERLLARQRVARHSRAEDETGT